MIEAQFELATTAPSERGFKLLAGPVSLLLLCVLPPPSNAQTEPMAFDGVERPHNVETGVAFRCAAMRVDLRYREEFHSLETTPALDRALQVSLLRITVSDRRVSTADRTRLNDLFRSFAWVTDTELRCFSGRAQLYVTAMPKRQWIDFIQRRLGERPSPNRRVIEISRSGEIIIDARDF